LTGEAFPQGKSLGALFTWEKKEVVL